MQLPVNYTIVNVLTTDNITLKVAINLTGSIYSFVINCFNITDIHFQKGNPFEFSLINLNYAYKMYDNR